MLYVQGREMRTPMCSSPVVWCDNRPCIGVRHYSNRNRIDSCKNFQAPYTHTGTCVERYIEMCTYVCMHTHMYYVHMSVHVYLLSLHVCMYVCLHNIHTYMQEY